MKRWEIQKRAEEKKAQKVRANQLKLVEKNAKEAGILLQSVGFVRVTGDKWYERAFLESRNPDYPPIIARVYPPGTWTWGGSKDVDSWSVKFFVQGDVQKATNGERSSFNAWVYGAAHVVKTVIEGVAREHERRCLKLHNKGLREKLQGVAKEIDAVLKDGQFA